MFYLIWSVHTMICEFRCITHIFSEFHALMHGFAYIV